MKHNFRKEYQMTRASFREIRDNAVGLATSFFGVTQDELTVEISATSTIDNKTNVTVWVTYDDSKPKGGSLVPPKPSNNYGKVFTLDKYGSLTPV